MGCSLDIIQRVCPLPILSRYAKPLAFIISELNSPLRETLMERELHLHLVFQASVMYKNIWQNVFSSLHLVLS